MFGAVENVSKRWVEEQREILSDVGQLVAVLEPGCGSELLKLIDDLGALNESCRLQICRDHVFQSNLDAVRLATITACESGGQLDSTCLYRFTALTRLAIAVLTKTDAALSLLPLAGSRVLLPAVGIRVDIPRPEAIASSDWHQQSIVEGGRVLLGGVELPQDGYSRSGNIKVVDRDLDFFWDRSTTLHNITLDDGIDTDQWIHCLENSRRLMATTKSGQCLVDRFVSYVVPLQQGTGDINLSFSARNFPSVVFKNHETVAHAFGETLIHEADHQFFYANERFERFFLIDPPNMKALFFSPWRDDARPVDGILRGLSAFARVSEYYASVLISGIIDAQQREAIEALLIARLVEAGHALATVSNSKELSEFGKGYVREIGELLQRILQFAMTFTRYEVYRARTESIVDSRRRKFQENFQGASDVDQGLSGSGL